MTVAAVFFDVDGTLVTGKSSAQYLAGFIGHEDLVAAAYAEWDAGLRDSASVELLDAGGWAGVSRGEVREWLTGLPLVDGIPDVLAWCSRNDVLAALATLAWEPVGEYLCDVFGFEASCGAGLELADGCYTGAVAHHFGPFAKRDFAQELAGSAGLSMNRCAAIGDSRSDVPLFGDVGLAVAFNGDEHVMDIADVQISGNDLREVLPALEAWLFALDEAGNARQPAALGVAAPDDPERHGDQGAG
ncbi:MAG: haloacid dehalogenase-like hydrolase [Nocardiopsaceae bacterium]|jgi:phosphoserine phosphatase|nr:haloacid dehalogenase-like hydrolase [Nocardiopsaceae bacterium]